MIIPSIAIEIKAVMLASCVLGTGRKSEPRNTYIATANIANVSGLIVILYIRADSSGTIINAVCIIIRIMQTIIVDLKLVVFMLLTPLYRFIFQNDDKLNPTPYEQWDYSNFRFRSRPTSLKTA